MLELKDGLETPAQAFETFYQDNQHALSTAAYSVVRNPTDVQDVVQDSAIKIWQRFEKSTFPSNPAKRYSLEIAHNTAIDHQRRNKTQGRSALSLDDPTLSLPTIQGRDPQEEFGKKEKLTLVLAAISQLPLDHRELIFDYYFREKTLKVMAEERNQPLGTLLPHLYRDTLGRMRAILAAAGYSSYSDTI